MVLKKLIKYRTCWMGFAILWIIAFHSNFNFPGSLLRFLVANGFGGVDIFIFASGLGCYYSLEAEPDPCIFLKKRFLRLAPEYWSFLLIWIPIMYFWYGYPLLSLLPNFLFLQEFTSYAHSFNWYLSALWAFYIIAPFLHSLINRLSVRGYHVAFAGVCLFAVLFINTYSFIVCSARLILFYMGMLLGRLSKEDKSISGGELLLPLALCVLGFVIIALLSGLSSMQRWLTGLCWFPFVLIVPGLCLAISLVCQRLENTAVGTWAVKALTLVGKYSFELFLSHIFIFDILKDKLGALPHQRLLWIGGVLALVPAVMIIKSAGRLFNKVFLKKVLDN